MTSFVLFVSCTVLIPFLYFVMCLAFWHIRRVHEDDLQVIDQELGQFQAWNELEAKQKKLMIRDLEYCSALSALRIPSWRCDYASAWKKVLRLKHPSLDFSTSGKFIIRDGEDRKIASAPKISITRDENFQKVMEAYCRHKAARASSTARKIGEAG